MLKHYIFKYKNFGSAPSGSPLGHQPGQDEKSYSGEAGDTQDVNEGKTAL